MNSVDPDDRYATAYAVASYGTSTKEYSVFGIVDNTRFCCTIDEDSTDKVLDIVLKGTATCDGLHFSWDDGSGGDPEENLEPGSNGSITATILAGAGPAEGLSSPPVPGATGCQGDFVVGSNYQGGDYKDILFGESGPDYLYGLNDKDWLSGGGGDDTLYGGTGNDILTVDHLYGEDGQDNLCDSNGSITCLEGCNGGDLLNGGANNDQLWYADDWSCSGSPSSSSDCGGGQGDVWGYDPIWSYLAYIDCEVPTNLEVDCSFP
jgi:Ca2+-binding RTX toxin-like protein